MMCKRNLLVITAALLLVLLLASCEMFSAKPEQGTLRIITIGLEYTDAPDMRANILSGSVNDALAMGEAFKALGQKAGQNVEVISLVQGNPSKTPSDNIYPNKGNILNTIESLTSETKEEDVTVVFFSGHGAAEADAEVNGKSVYYGPKSVGFSSDVDYSDSFYFVTGAKDNNGRTALFGNGNEEMLLSGSELTRALNNLNGKTAIIADCCHSGALVSAKGADVDTTDFNCNAASLAGNMNVNSESNTYVLTAARRYENSYESKAVDGQTYGLFTSTVLEGLGYDVTTGKLNSTPAAKNGNLTLNGIYAYAAANDRSEAQTPKVSGGPVDLVLFQF